MIELLKHHISYICLLKSNSIFPIKNLSLTLIKSILEAVLEILQKVFIMKLYDLKIGAVEV